MELTAFWKLRAMFSPEPIRLGLTLKATSAVARADREEFWNEGWTKQSVEDGRPVVAAYDWRSDHHAEKWDNRPGRDGNGWNFLVAQHRQRRHEK